MPEKKKAGVVTAGQKENVKSGVIIPSGGGGCQVMLPLYRTRTRTSPAKKLSLSEMVQLVENPGSGPKDTAPLITPYNADAKKDTVAQESLYYALPVDHDHDNLTIDGIRQRYDPYNISYIAWTTSSHQQDGKGNRWKVLILFAAPCGFALWLELARGAALTVEGDQAQARSQQGFYAPNILYTDAPYEYIIHLDRPFLDPAEPFHPFTNDALTAYTKELEKQTEQAAAALPKPRAVNAVDGGIIDLINAAYSLVDVLAAAGVKKAGKKYLSPYSESKSPGGIILNRDGKDVYYSHHGPADPLSNQNNGGHSLDVADVLCITKYGGDIHRMVRELAPVLDPEGQKQRQREYMENNSTPPVPPKKKISLAGFSLYGRTDEMKQKMLDDVHILGRLALLGEITMWFAKFNAGKTLVLLHLLKNAISSGILKGEDVFYVNADDSFKGLVSKNAIADKYGFHQLAPGQGPDRENTFKPELLIDYIQVMINEGDAKGKVIILDTYKKFCDPMSKDKTKYFFSKLREFVMVGGSVVALAHVNKHKGEDGKVVYEGVADGVNDPDCAYTIDVIRETFDGERTIKFENMKQRGDTAMTASYCYDCSSGLPYYDRLASVREVGEDELREAEEQRKKAVELAKDQAAIDAITAAIMDGTHTKTALVDAAADTACLSKNKIRNILQKYTGSDYSKGKLWFVGKGDKHSKHYELNFKYYKVVTGNEF